MIGDILVCFVLQIGFTVGTIVVFGFLIALCNKRFYANFGNYGRTVNYVTGVIGTPLHECAHALFCVIFRHKIVEIKLFQINAADGTLGYVRHSYDKKSIYQRSGNFFIGIAPIIVISAVLYLSAYFLLPDFIAEINGSFRISDFVSNIGKVFVSILSVLRTFFVCALSWQWWAFVFVGMFLAPHMTLSKPDIKGAWSGLLFLLVFVLTTDVILGLVNENLLTIFTRTVLNAASYLLCILVLALMISMTGVAVSYLFRAIKRR